MVQQHRPHKRPINDLWALFLIFCIYSSAQAGQFLADDSRVLTAASGEVELWSEYEYVNKHIDVFDFQSQTSKTTTFEKEQAVKLGGNWRATPFLGFRAATLVRSGSVTRSSAPKNLDAKQQLFSLGGQFIINDNKSALEMMLYTTSFANQIIYKYQQGQIIFGEDIQLLNPQTLELLPIVQLSMKTKGASLGYFQHIMPTGRLSYDLGFNYKFTDIAPSVSSVLFEITDEALLDSRINGQLVSDAIADLKNKLPQQNRWQEHTLSFEGCASAAFSNTLSALVGVKGLWISRSNYIAGSNEKQINNNLVLTTRLEWAPLTNIKLYASAKAYKNYLAGIDAGAYNRRVAHLFDNPYVRFGAGLSYQF